jgi:hypothetical protein
MGENPKLWIRRGEDYVELYIVDQSMWITHQSGFYALLYCNCKTVKASSWSEFCQLILERFGEDQSINWINMSFFLIFCGKDQHEIVAQQTNRC